jgi:hypothetical protein
VIRVALISLVSAASVLLPTVPAHAIPSAEFVTTCDFQNDYIRFYPVDISNVDPTRYEAISFSIKLQNVDTGRWVRPIEYTTNTYWPWTAIQGPGYIPLWYDMLTFWSPPAPVGRYNVYVDIWWGWNDSSGVFGWRYESGWRYPGWPLLRQGTAGTGYGPNEFGAYYDYTCNLSPPTESPEVGFSSSHTSLSRVGVATALSRAAALRPSTSEHFTKGTIADSCAAPTIPGTNESETITGTSGNDIIAAGGGDDTVFAGGGNDVICGGPGDDGLVGESGDDLIVGEAGLDILLGNGGADVLRGGADADLADGGSRRDRMDGGAGQGDLLAYLDANQGVHVDFASNSATGAGDERFRRFEGVVGSHYDDQLVGAKGVQLFVPLDGPDRVNGGRGADQLFYLLSPGGVIVDLSKGTARGEGKDRVRSIESVVGSEYQDLLIGTGGRDFLHGWSGPDLLDGRGGPATLVGGSGTDECIRGRYFFSCENKPTDAVVPAPPGGANPPPSSPSLPE